MADYWKLTLPQALAVERQLLRDEKFIIDALKKIKEERYAFRKLLMELHVALQKVFAQGIPPNGQNAQPATSTDAPEVAAPTTHASLLSEFNLPSWDTNPNDVDLNLTVPSHNCQFLLDEQHYVETENYDEDFELDMSLLRTDVDNA